MARRNCLLYEYEMVEMMSKTLLTAGRDERRYIPLVELVNAFQIHIRILLGVKIDEVECGVGHELIEVTGVFFPLEPSTRKNQRRSQQTVSERVKLG